MQGQGFQPATDVFFDPSPNASYKILTVMNGNMCITLTNKGGRRSLTIEEYKGTDNQHFKVFNNQGRYAIVNGNGALHIPQDSQDDGALICLDDGQHQSSFVEIVPVGQGQWAGKACFIRTHAGKTYDINGGQCKAGADIKQWHYLGGGNQMWVIAPADAKHAKPWQKGQGQHGQQQPGKIVPPHHEVPEHVNLNPNVQYRIVSAARPRKALTVSSQGQSKCHLKPYKNDAHQRFKVMQEKDKHAFVLAHNNTALCVDKNDMFKDQLIIADAGQHQSSWFKIERCSQGQWRNKGYLIKTFAMNKVFDITGDYKDSPEIKQCGGHNAHNQMWLIVPADDPIPGKYQPGPHQQQGGHQGGHKFDVPSYGELLKGFAGWGKHQQQGGGNQGFGGGHQGGNQGFGGGNQGFGGGHQGGNQGFGGGHQFFKPNQTYAIISEGNHQKCMHVIDHGMKMGNLAIHDRKGSQNQKFYLQPEGPNKYRIRSAANGHYVNVTHDTDGDTLWIRTDPKGHHKSEVWSIQNKYGNVFHLKSVFGKGIDVAANNYTNDSILIQYSFHGNANQSWVIQEA